MGIDLHAAAQDFGRTLTLNSVGTDYGWARPLCHRWRN